MFKGNERNKSVGRSVGRVVSQSSGKLGMQEGKLRRQEGSLSVCLCLSIGQSVEWWRLLGDCRYRCNV